jgi:hypothetical protein
VTDNGAIVFNLKAKNPDGTLRELPSLGSPQGRKLQARTAAAIDRAMDDFVDALAEAEDTCALDIAEGGGGKLQDIGDRFGFVRERARQIQEDGMRKLRRRAALKEAHEHFSTLRGNTSDQGDFEP